MIWNKVPLKSIASIELGKMLDDEKNQGEEHEYLANINIRWGEFDLSELRRMRFTSNELERFSIKKGDIVLCEGGEPGRCAIWKETDRTILYQKALHRIRCLNDTNSRFLYYQLSRMGKAGELDAFFTGSTIKHLPKQNLELIEINLPIPSIQERLAEILSAYDDLIENNRRQIKLLEESARLLYREWFVRLRFPGYEQVKVVDGIPEGWEKKSLKSILALNYGKALKAEDRIEGEFCVYGSSGVVGMNSKPLVPGPGIIIGRKGNVGSVFWEPKPFWPIDTVYFISDESDLFLFYGLKTLHFTSTDVAVPGLNRDFAYSRELLVPTDFLRKSFNENVEVMHLQIENLLYQNQKLTVARDLLLPRLMSGEIEI